MTEPTAPPRDDLLRASYPAMELRAAEADGMPTMVGHFARFNEWTKIDSNFEGTFMERVAPGAFARTMKNNRDNIRVLFQHGRDPQVGDKPLGPITDLREDADGAYYEVPLLDTTYNRDILPGLQANLYGASFRFSVVQEDFEAKPKRSTHNPDALPERTIREARVMEFGPVTFPAYAGATAGVRSITTADLDAAIAPREMTEALPDAGPEAMPHSDEGTREAVEPTIPEAPSKEKHVESTPETRAARDREITDELARINSEHTGVLPADVEDRWAALTAEQDKVRADQAAYEARMARLEGAAADPKKVIPAVPQPFAAVRSYTAADIYDPEPWLRAGPQERNALLRDNAMRAIDNTKTYPNERTDVPKTQDRLGWLLDHVDSPDKQLAQRVILTGSPLYQRAFNKTLLGQALSPEEQRGTALAVGADGTGGFAVPFAFDPTMIAIGSHQGAINPYRANCRVVPIVGTDTWNPVTATAVVATRTTEAAASIEQGPTFAQGANGAYIVKRVQAFVTYSIEMGQDRPDLASEMARLIGEAKDNEEEASFAIGAGTTTTSLGVQPPYGTSNMYTQAETAGSTTLAAADAYAIEAALPVRWRFGARWVMNRGNIRKFQALETTGGILFGGTQYPAVGFVNNDAAGNTGLRLLGYPVDESPTCPTAATSHIQIATLFAPQTYIIVDRVGMNIELIPHLWATGMLPVGNRGVYAMWRNHAAPLLADAGRVLAFKT